MQNRVEFYPDIETKYEHLLTHMNDKNKITHELINILKEIVNLEEFYSTTLDKFANSISKLLVGKDPIKEVLITLDKILTSKSEGSSGLAKQIKDVMIPHIESSINVKAQQKLKDSQINVRNIRASMQRKLRMLLASQNNFKKAVIQVNSLPKIITAAQKDKALESYRKKQDQFSDTIDSYNSSLDQYMLKYSQICEELTQLETNRKSHFRDAVGELIILQINYLKNMEYDYAKYAKQLKKMQGKLLIQDKMLGGSEQFFETKEGGIVHLAKLSNKNYIDNVVGKKKVNENLLGEELMITDLKSKYPPGQVTKQIYHGLAKTIFPIINFIHKNNHTNLLIQVVFFSKDLLMPRGDLKVSLLNSLVSHELFSDENFWINYEKRLLEKISRQQNVTSGDEQMLLNNFNHVLDRDLTMLRNVQINPYITRVIQNVCQKAKLVIIQPVPQISQNAMAPQNNVRIIATPFKYKIYQ